MIIILSLDAPKSILETEKTLKTLSSSQIYIYKNQKTPKNPLFLNRVFSNPACIWLLSQARVTSKKSRSSRRSLKEWLMFRSKSFHLRQNFSCSDIFIWYNKSLQEHTNGGNSFAVFTRKIDQTQKFDNFKKLRNYESL